MRRIFAALALLAAAWMLLPLAAGVSHIGMYFAAGALAVCAAVLLALPALRRILRRRGGFLRALAAVCGCMALLLPLCLFCTMAAAHTDIEQLPYGSVAVVLGCGVNGSEPSAMLRARCEHALALLRRDKTALCIASGGQGPGEDITEAEAIRRYLTERGIENERILTEPHSTDTQQNVKNSLALMRQMGLSGDVVIVSDRFHLWRGCFYAAQEGVQALASGCRTDPFLAPGYWVRDMGGVLLLLLGVQG